MNHFYRVIFNKSLNILQASSEFAKSYGKSKDTKNIKSKTMLTLPQALVCGLMLIAPVAFAAAPAPGDAGITKPATFTSTLAGTFVTTRTINNGQSVRILPGSTHRNRIDDANSFLINSGGKLLLDGLNSGDIKIYNGSNTMGPNAAIRIDGANALAWVRYTDITTTSSDSRGIYAINGGVTVFEHTRFNAFSAVGSNQVMLVVDSAAAASKAYITDSLAAMTHDGSVVLLNYRGISGLLSASRNTLSTLGNNSYGILTAGITSGGPSSYADDNNIYMQGNNSKGLSTSSKGEIYANGNLIITGVKLGASGQTTYDSPVNWDVYGRPVDAFGNLLSSNLLPSSYVASGSTGSYAVYAESASSITLDASAANATRIIGLGNDSIGLYATGANSMINSVSTTLTTTIDMLGNNAIGGKVAAGGVLSLQNTAITTTGNQSHGLVIDGAASVLQLNHTGGSNTIVTSGDGAHGIVVQHSANKIFDGAVNNILPTITVNGTNSALLNVTDAGSAMTLVNRTLDIANTPNANTFGVKVENSAVINLDATDMGGTALWANNGRINAQNGTDLSGARIKLEDAGILDISALSPTDVAMGSLESNDALSKIVGGNKNLIIGQNSASNNGSLVDNADFKGNFENINQLIKTGATTQILSGIGNTVGNVEVQSGTLKFTQDNGILNQGTPFSVTGDYTIRVGATTSIGNNNSTLMIGGAFIQEASTAQGHSTLEILLGASPDIQARTAQLAGILNFTGFSASLNPIKASTIIGGAKYEMIRTTDGIIGSYAELDGVDYLISQGFTSPDNKSYLLGFGFAWTEGGYADGTGSFTMIGGSALDVDIALNDQTGPFVSGWNGQDLIKNDAGELILSAHNGYTGSTTINGGTLYLVGNGNISTSNSVTLTQANAKLDVSNITTPETRINNLSGMTGSIVNLGDKNLSIQNTQDTVFAGDFDVASGGLIKDGPQQLTLSGKTQYTGDTKINEGKLVLDGINGGAQLTSHVIGQTGTILSLRNGATLTGSIDPLDLEIDAESTWNMTADSLIDHMNLAGNVNFVAPVLNDFKTLVVQKNWIGNNGLVRMNTVLGNDASLTDTITIQGDTSGTTRVAINNIGGVGAQTLNGIQLIEVQGQSLGEFTQIGRIVAGAYDYNLGRSQVNNKNWVLSSKLTPITTGPIVPSKNEHIIRPEAGSYLANIKASSLFANIERPNADRYYLDANTGKVKSTSLWFTTKIGETRSWDEYKQVKSDIDHQVMMLGGDASFNTGDVGNLRLGAMAGYAHSSSDSRSVVTKYRSEGKVSGYSVGLYANWQQHPEEYSGVFIDSSVQYSWLKNEVKGELLRSEDYNSDGVIAALAAGYTFKVAGDDSLAYFLQPKAQVTFLGVTTDDFRESNGTIVRMNDGNILQTKLGLRGFVWFASQDTSTNWNISTEINWINQSNDFYVQMNDVKVNMRGAKNIAEIKLGLDAQFNKKLNIWGNVGYQRGSNKYQDMSANVGIKYQF